MILYTLITLTTSLYLQLPTHHQSLPPPNHQETLWKLTQITSNLKTTLPKPTTFLKPISNPLNPNLDGYAHIYKYKIQLNTTTLNYHPSLTYSIIAHEYLHLLLYLNYPNLKPELHHCWMALNTMNYHLTKTTLNTFFKNLQPYKTYKTLINAYTQDYLKKRQCNYHYPNLNHLLPPPPPNLPKIPHPYPTTTPYHLHPHHTTPPHPTK